uniref:Lantibiotic dehydratase n=1 Tax=Lactococcus lactis TaxID=1358 RepID=B5MET7_9LACT|nr:lantibiotic dehydratase [Lactococcus lactis]
MIQNSFKAQPFLVRNTILSVKDKQSFTEYTQVIETANNNKVFLEQLLIANPKLYDTLQKYNAGLLKKKRVKKLFESVYKYYKRSYLRSTPFGLFSETSIGTFSENSKSELNGETTKGVILDTQWLIRLVHQMERDFSRKLSFVINNANYEFGDRIFQVYTINSSDLEEVNIKSTNVYQIISKTCESGFQKYEEICESVTASYGDEYRELSEQYINSLIVNHYLVSNLQKDILSDFSWETFLNKVEEIDDSKKYLIPLKRVQKLIQEYSELEIGEGLEKLKEIYQEMSQILANDNYIQIDLFSDSEITFDTEQKQQLERLADFIGNTTKSVNRTYLDDYKDKFIEKYGVDQEVQIVELFDSTFGIGAPYNYTHPQNDFYELEPNTAYFSEEEREKYLSKYVEAIKNNEAINFEDLESHYQKIAAEKNSKLQGLELFLDLAKKDEKDIFVLGNIIGNNNLGGASGRFSALSPELKNYHKSIVDSIEKENESKGITSCEIVFLPENIRHANVMHTSIERKRVLPVFTSTSHDEVQLTNIYIGIDDNEEFYARDISTQEVLKFYVTSMYNKTLFSNELRFLYEISLDDNFGNLPWELIYRDFDYVPRLVFGDIVVSPAKWKIREEDMKTEEITKEFLQSKGVPKEFYIVNGDNKVYLSQENLLDMSMLEAQIKKSAKRNDFVELQEYIEDGDVVSKRQKGRVSDVVVPFVRKTTPDNDSKKFTREKRVSVEQREKLPFTDWLYIKLYISTNRQDEFLLSYLPEIQEIIENLGGQLFFLRYTDPQPHIRLRIKCSNLFLAYNSILEILKKSRENRVMSTFDISTYDQEVERYGGFETLELSEQIFCADSKTIPTLLTVTKEANNDWSVDDVSILMDYRYLKWFFQNDNQEILKFLHLVSPEKVEENVNEKIVHYHNLLETDNLDGRIFSDKNFEDLKRTVEALFYKMVSQNYDTQKVYSIIDSIIHVHNNRLIGINRDKEKVIYYGLQRLFTSEEYMK